MLARFLIACSIVFSVVGIIILTVSTINDFKSPDYPKPIVKLSIISLLVGILVAIIIVFITK